MAKESLNPLLTTPSNIYGAPEFDKIEPQHYLPAFEYAIDKAKREIDQIADNKDKPTFKNTIEALEYCGEELDNIGNIFFNLNEALYSEQMQKIAEKVSPALTELSLYELANNKLFKRVNYLWEERAELNLTKEECRLLEKKHRAFILNGASLSNKKKIEYAKCREKLSLLSLKFGENTLRATNDYILHITNPADLQGIPDNIKEAAKEDAAERKLQGWVFTLQSHSYIPFLKFSEKRDLREKIWKKYNSRCVGGKFDNTKIVIEILKLRQKIAKLIGFENYAEYSLSSRMAKNVKAVDDFLELLLKRSRPYADREIADIERLAGYKIMPWDYAYWENKLRESKFEIDDNIIRPYFKLDNVVNALFILAKKLYGITFTELFDVPVYHKDVRVYRVDDRRKKFLALFYIDLFPRESKRPGAWMTNFREQSFRPNATVYDESSKRLKEDKCNYVEQRPLVSIVCNFTKPTKKRPSLLTFAEFETILHEFGHALHGFFANGKYASLSGTNVGRDFVELPSQLMENYATESKFLKMWAKHYKSGKTIPDSIIEKLKESKNFSSGYQCVRQLTFGMTDMAIHSKINLSKWNKTTLNECVKKVIEIERNFSAPTQLFSPIEKCSFLPTFSHIFAGGYSAGYYSYKWAEVLEADAFELFKEKGIFNREICENFRKYILSVGSAEDENISYKKFRGRSPKVSALLRAQGMGRALKTNRSNR